MPAEAAEVRGARGQARMQIERRDAAAGPTPRAALVEYEAFLRKYPTLAPSAEKARARIKAIK